MRHVLRPLLVLMLLLLTAFNAFAADSFLCSDTDQNGVIGILKTLGVVDRDCNHEASAADGGPDCLDTDWRVYQGSYNTTSCAGGQYRICDAAGSGAFGGCSSADLHTAGYNTYYVSGSGSGTLCTAGAPCAVTAVGNGGSVTTVNPVEIILVGSTDITGTVGWSPQIAGVSSVQRSIFRRDPRSPAKFNLNPAPNGAIYVGFNNWIIEGFELTGQDATSHPGIKSVADNVEIKGNWIHELQCYNNDNCGGIYIGEGVANNWAHDNLITNVYDGTRVLIAPVGGSPDLGDRQNVFLIRGFRGNGNIIEKNLVAYSHPPRTTPYEKQGSGISQKHGNTIAGIGVTTEIRWNVITNTELTGVADNSAGVHTHGNLILGGSQGIAVGPGGDGGSAAWHDIEIHNNTIVGASRNIGGVFAFGGATTETTAGGVDVAGNVVDDSATSPYGGGNHKALVDIDNYGSDANYTALFITKNVFNFYNNCYFNSAVVPLTLGFNVYGDNASTSLGSTTNYAGWNGTYSKDLVGTVVVNPVLGPEYQVTAGCPIGIVGWEAEWPGVVIPPAPSANARGRELRSR